MIFADRQDAGEKLADLVAKKVHGNGLVLGIPRGGVVVAKAVAARLNWPLAAIHAKKIGAPGNPELAVGAKVWPPPPQVKGFKQLILVDDGVATGYTLEAAINYLKKSSPKAKLAAAVPVAAKDSAERLKKLVDQWICLYEPEELMAVGQFYREFEPVSVFAN